MCRILYSILHIYFIILGGDKMKFDNENVVLKFIIVSNILNAFIIYIFNKYDFLAGLSKIKTEYIIVFLIRFYFLT